MSEIKDNTDEDLKETRGHRYKIVKQILADNDNKYPTDPKELKVFLATLDGISKDAVSIKRIKVDEKNNDVKEQNRQIAAEILRTIMPGRVDALPVIVDVRASPIVDTNSIPRPTFVEGETDIHNAGENYDSFSKRMGMNRG